VKLNGANYPIWKFQIIAFFKVKRLYELIDRDVCEDMKDDSDVIASKVEKFYLIQRRKSFCTA
jgi:hypothetical protein